MAGKRRSEKIKLLPHEINLVIALCELGHSDEAISRAVRLPYTTYRRAIENSIYNEKLKNEVTGEKVVVKSMPLVAVLKECKNSATMRVEASLYQQAIKGNVAAIVVYLCNRAPERWHNTNRIEHTGGIDIRTKSFVGWTPEEWDKTQSDRNAIVEANLKHVDGDNGKGGNGNGNGKN